MTKIIPTVFATTKDQFEKRLEKITFTKNIQIDIMDGKFVKLKSPDLQTISFPKNRKYEAHLMVENSEKYFPILLKKNFEKIIIHFESKFPEKKSIRLLKTKNKKVWLAINPETKIREIEKIVKNFHGILFMGVKPGKEKQKFIKNTFNKIKTFKKKFPNKKTQVDGGINPKIAKKLSEKNVTFINIGSYISSSQNPKEVFEKLQKQIK